MSDNRFSRRERRAREKAQPILNREHREILVGRQYGAVLKTYLEAKGIKSSVREESFIDIIGLGGATDLDEVDRLITEWLNGADYMTFDLNQEQMLVYSALIHAVKTNSGIGFHNNDQGHPAYCIHADGSTSNGMGDSPEENKLYQILRSLTEELGESACVPIRSWADFCKLASDGHQQSCEMKKRLS